MDTLITIPHWKLDESIEFLRLAQPFAHHAGYHLGLAGGVLNKGYSPNDLDILVMPLNDHEEDRSLDGLWRAFRMLGCDDSFVEITKQYPSEAGRIIWRTHHTGRQMDLFVYERLPLIERIRRRVRSWFRRVVIISVS